MRDSTAELEIMLCWFPPVTGLKGTTARTLVSDLVAGFSPHSLRVRAALPTLGGNARVAPTSSAVQALGRGREERRFPRTVLEGAMLCPVFPRAPRIRFHWTWKLYQA